MTAIFRLFLFEFALIRMLFFRVIFERLTNTFMAATAAFFAVYLGSYLDTGFEGLPSDSRSYPIVQSMILFAFLYAETIMANWQYTTNKSGRMELIFNSTQPPLLIIFIKSFASACVTLLSMVLLYLLPMAWLGLLGALNATFWLSAAATMLVCCCIMSFNAIFEFKFKQVKTLTSVLNLLMPYLATTYAHTMSDAAGFLPYFNGAKFINLNLDFTAGDVAWLFFTAVVTASVFLLLAQLTINRVRSTASVYLE
jgi:hypothetical protein